MGRPFNTGSAYMNRKRAPSRRAKPRIWYGSSQKNHQHTCALQWSRKAICGMEWLQAREAGRGWMLLVMRAWREEVARSAGRGGGRGVGAEARRARNLGAPSQNSASFVSFRQTFGKRRSISTKNAFPVFSTSAEATKAFWHIRAVTNYMRLTHTAHIAHKRARTARAAVQEYAKEEVKRASKETTR